MPYDPDRHHRRSLRLRDYDYAQAGAYFVTVCVYERACLLGEVADGAVRLSEFGHIVDEEWRRTPAIRPQVDLDAWVVMPNHVHVIVVFADVSVGAYGNTPLRKTPPQRPPASLRSPSQTLGAVIRGFKAITTRRINRLRESPGVPVWQRNFYEHVIRDEADLDRVRRYITDNPAGWHDDPENPVYPRADS